MSDWQTDAALAGTLYKKSKPYTAMLIARCVEPQQGARTDLCTSAKVTAKAFADEADIAPNTVLKYLRTWDLLAEQGYVPARDELEPGEDVEVPEMKIWTPAYREANPPKEKKPREPSPEDDSLDLRGRVDYNNSRVQRALEQTFGLSTGSKYAAPMGRIKDAVQSIGFGDNPNRAFVSLVVALSDLAADLPRD